MAQPLKKFTTLARARHKFGILKKEIIAFMDGVTRCYERCVEIIDNSLYLTMNCTNDVNT